MKLVLLICFTSQALGGYQFPPNFKFGVASSAYQIEGGAFEDGKGKSVWDRVSHSVPSIIADGSNGDIACDSYHQWQRDVEMVKQTGVHLYRFSLAWTRLFPKGYITEQPNPAGVAYYKNLISALKSEGIEPVVTIYHWDLPQTISTLGGLANSAFINFYGYYARKVFELFGDDVKTWITFNEPKVVCEDFNALLASLDPWYPSGVIEYECTHNLIRAHALAYHIYDKEFRAKQKGKISITLNFEWSEPASDSAEDEAAAEQRRQFEFGLYANPIINYDYPKIVKERIASRSNLQGFPQSRLPAFTLAEKLFIHNTYDFLGLNHYFSWLVQPAPEQNISIISYDSDEGTSRYQDPSWPSSGSGSNKVVPWGLRHALNWIKKTYRNPEVYITECGYPDNITKSYEELINDEDRIEFFKLYINATLQAYYEDRVKVTVFTAWSIMDNFEWNQGYTIKFGLFYVNFTDIERERTPKNSVAFFNSIIANNQLPD